MRYADPSNDEKAQNIDESEREREETAIATQRLYNQAYLQRRRRPQEFGVQGARGARGSPGLSTSGHLS